MSRLDSFIRRLEAQRACLDRAAELIGGLDGFVLELGLGNGRTYDHLRSLFPDRAIYVCERQVAAHPLCVPPPDMLILGDMRETLDGGARLARRAGRPRPLRCRGPATPAANQALAAELTPSIVPLLCAGAVLATDPSIDCPDLETLPLPDGVAPGRYHLYRRVSS